MNLAALQFDIAWENKTANFHTVHRLLAAASPENETLVVLPEMFATGFSMNTTAIAEDYGGPTEQFLSAAAKEFGIWLVGGSAMRDKSGRVRNKALVFSPAGDLTAFYAKMQPFTLGGERDHYVAGEQPVIFQWQSCRVSPFVCYDLRFPELFRKAAATRQPELFLVIANWPDKRIIHWVRLLQARAIENQAYVLGVNRIGTDPFYTYPGRSLLADPHGEIVADAGASETCLRASLDLTTLQKYRQGLPFLADLRP